MEYVISTGPDNLTLAMYESNDFRLKSKSFMKEGSFKKNRSSLKGLINGNEDGIFTSIDNEVYIVFTDWSIKKLSPPEIIKVNELIQK